METKKIEAALLAFEKANGITDKELEILLEFFGKLVPSLELMGPRYHFAWKDAFDKLRTLEGFRDYRVEASCKGISKELVNLIWYHRINNDHSDTKSMQELFDATTFEERKRKVQFYLRNRKIYASEAAKELLPED